MNKSNVVKEVIKTNDISSDDVMNTLKIITAAQIDINNDLSFAVQALKDMAFDASDRIDINNKKSLLRFILLLLAGGAYVVYNERRYNAEHPQI